MNITNPYALRGFTYRTEHVRAYDVRGTIVYTRLRRHRFRNAHRDQSRPVETFT